MNNRNHNLKDLTGMRFCAWTVLDDYRIRVTPSGWRCLEWYCECDCGTKRYVRGSNLTSGRSLSCGCLRDAMASIRLTRENEEPNAKPKKKDR
jgi:hypothetical protein